MSATWRTPAKFIVPLLMLTTLISSASASALCASTAFTTARSLALNPAPAFWADVCPGITSVMLALSTIAANSLCALTCSSRT